MNATLPIGPVVKRHRQAAGMTMAAVRKAGGPSEAFQSDIERGEKINLGLPLFVAWARAIGADPHSLFAEILAAAR